MKLNFKVEVVPTVDWRYRKASKLPAITFTAKKFIELAGHFDTSEFDVFEDADQFGTFIIGKCLIKGKFVINCNDSDISRYMHLPKWNVLQHEEFNEISFCCSLTDFETNIKLSKNRLPKNN